MSDLSFEKGAAEELAARLQSAKGELGRPYDGRWRWWRKWHRSAKALKALKETTPTTVTRYDGAKKRINDTSRDVCRTRRRHVFWLWLRIFFASLCAFLQRARLVILIFAVIVGFSVASYYYGPSVIRFLIELVTADEAEDASEDQIMPSSQAPPAPSATPQSSAPTPPVTGPDVPSRRAK